MHALLHFSIAFANDDSDLALTEVSSKITGAGGSAGSPF
jgi:hypothetical protein